MSPSKINTDLSKFLELSEKVNPRWLIRQPNGRLILKHRLKLAGYAAKDDVLDALEEALFTNEIMLLEGNPGVGKTMLYQAMLKAFHFVNHQLNSTVETEHHDIIGNFQTTLQNQFVMIESTAGGKQLEQIADESWNLKFFKMAQPLRAYVTSPIGKFDAPDIIPNGLLLDEIDKLRETVQDSCLQLFNDLEATIDGLLPEPTLGLPSGAILPFVIFTSNNMRGGVSNPLRDRAGVFLHIATPSPEEEYVILKTKFPAIGDLLLRQILKLIHAVRDDDMIKQKPQIRAATKLVKSLAARGISDFTKGESDNPLRNAENAIRQRIGVLIKQSADFLNAQASITAYASKVTRRDEFDEIIEKGAELYRRNEQQHIRAINEFTGNKPKVCLTCKTEMIFFRGDQLYCTVCEAEETLEGAGGGGVKR